MNKIIKSTFVVLLSVICGAQAIRENDAPNRTNRQDATIPNLPANKPIYIIDTEPVAPAPAALPVETRAQAMERLRREIRASETNSGLIRVPNKSIVKDSNP